MITSEDNQKITGVTVKENSLPKKLILKNKKIISSVIKNGKRFNRGSLRIILMKDIEESNFKVAFLVSKRLGKRAVLRNRIKRYLREIFRTNKLYFPQNYDIIMTVKTAYINIGYKLLEKEFMSIVTSEEFTDYLNKNLPTDIISSKEC